MSDLADAIRSYITDNVAWDGDPADLALDTPLFDDGVLDSMAVVGLIGFLEDEYGLEIDEEEVVLVNFGSIADMTRFIDAKRTGAAPG